MLQTVFQFICHNQQRDENLVHSLECLHETRVLAMLYFHIANRCRGMGILDDIMRRKKNLYFYTLGFKPDRGGGHIPRLYCLPRSVISTCIRGIIEDHCGASTADFVQKYLVYLQHWFGQALKSVGFESNICDLDISSDVVPNRLPIPSDYTKFVFFWTVADSSPWDSPGYNIR